MDPLAQRLLEHARAGQPVALAVVMRYRGSLPMSRRAKLLVTAAGAMHGTVGGGCVEAEVYGVARRLLQEGGSSLDSFALSEVESGLGGHVCGGTVTVLTLAVPESEAYESLAEHLARARSTGPEAVLAVRMPGAVAPSRAAAASMWMIDGQGSAGVGEAPPPAVAGAAVALLASGDSFQELKADGAIWYLEVQAPEPTVRIYGAGHCGLAIGEAAARCGFRVVLLDDREAFLQPQRSAWAMERQRVDFASVPEPEAGDYLVLVTRGHDHDLELLRQLLPLPWRYLGMIGSRRKRALFERELVAAGADAERLRRLRSPMGLAIGADTPEEIAVAVVAEMIAERRGCPVPPERDLG